jgi:hypothetical protein
MAIDTFIEAAARTLIGVILTEIFYWPGWLILRVVTLGRYPPSKAIKHNRDLVSIIGFAVVLIGVTIYYSMRHI